MPGGRSRACPWKAGLASLACWQKLGFTGANLQGSTRSFHLGLPSTSWLPRSPAASVWSARAGTEPPGHGQPAPSPRSRGAGKALGPGQQPGPELGPSPRAHLEQNTLPPSSSLSGQRLPAAHTVRGRPCQSARLRPQFRSPYPELREPCSGHGEGSLLGCVGQGQANVSKGRRPGPRAAGWDSCPEMPGKGWGAEEVLQR